MRLFVCVGALTWIACAPAQGAGEGDSAEAGSASVESSESSESSGAETVGTETESSGETGAEPVELCGREGTLVQVLEPSDWKTQLVSGGLLRREDDSLAMYEYDGAMRWTTATDFDGTTGTATVLDGRVTYLGGDFVEGHGLVFQLAADTGDALAWSSTNEPLRMAGVVASGVYATVSDELDTAPYDLIARVDVESGALEMMQGQVGNAEFTSMARATDSNLVRHHRQGGILQLTDPADMTADVYYDVQEGPYDIWSMQLGAEQVLFTGPGNSQGDANGVRLLHRGSGDVVAPYESEGVLRAHAVGPRCAWVSRSPSQSGTAPALGIELDPPYQVTQSAIELGYNDALAGLGEELFVFRADGAVERVQ